MEKAVTQREFKAVQDAINRIDGMPAQKHTFDVDETIGKIEIEIVTNKKDDNIKTEINNNTPEKPGSLPKEGK
jgi:hypothetical protein